MDAKNQYRLNCSRIIPAIIAALAVIALVYIWAKHTPIKPDFIFFLASGMGISYALPKLIESWRTGKLVTGVFFTFHRDKKPIHFFVNLFTLALVNIGWVFISIWCYLSIFDIAHFPK
jgi:hypothetical protein